MNGNDIALDTSVAIALLNDSQGRGKRIQALGSICLPVPVVGELRFGAVNSGRSAANLERIERLVTRSTVLDITRRTCEHYADVRLRLKRAGNPIPENDVWIAAVCLQHGIRLATDDAHFRMVDELEVVT